MSINLSSIGFFGQKGVEFLLWDESILVEVGSFDHFLQGVVVSELSQILGDSSEVLQSDETWIKLDLPVFWLS